MVLCTRASGEFHKAILEFWHFVDGATEDTFTKASHIISLMTQTARFLSFFFQEKRLFSCQVNSIFSATSYRSAPLSFPRLNSLFTCHCHGAIYLIDALSISFGYKLQHDFFFFFSNARAVWALQPLSSLALFVAWMVIFPFSSLKLSLQVA